MILMDYFTRLDNGAMIARCLKTKINHACRFTH